MKPIVFGYSIAILAFVVGVGVTFFYFSPVPVPESFDKVNLAKIPSVDYCEIVRNPQKYNGKIVRIENIKILWFMHGFYFEDEKCRGEGDSKRTAISFYEPKRETLMAVLGNFNSKNGGIDPNKALERIVTGRFTYRDSLGSYDAIEDRTLLQFEIYSIS
ncbi:MAG: hypothetical protein R2681_03770 [Pyrinomonadaceae bacterium]